MIITTESKHWNGYVSSVIYKQHSLKNITVIFFFFILACVLFVSGSYCCYIVSLYMYIPFCFKKSKYPLCSLCSHVLIWINAYKYWYISISKHINFLHIYIRVCVSLVYIIKSTIYSFILYEFQYSSYK